MKKLWNILLVFALFVLLPLPINAVVTTVNADTYVDSSSPDSNFGGALELKVSSTATAYFRFSLSALPTGITSGQVVKATLQLWEIPTSINPSGSISIRQLTSAFIAGSVTYNTRPSMASTTAVTVVASATSRYQEVDLTSLVKQWIDDPASNYGLAVLPASGSSTLNILYGSKWNTSGSQPALLDITLTSGRTFAVCVSPLKSDSGSCSCAVKTISKVSVLGSCTATSDTGECSASGFVGNPSDVYGSCCVCSF